MVLVKGEKDKQKRPLGTNTEVTLAEWWVIGIYGNATSLIHYHLLSDNDSGVLVTFKTQLCPTNHKTA